MIGGGERERERETVFSMLRTPQLRCLALREKGGVIRLLLGIPTCVGKNNHKRKVELEGEKERVATSLLWLESVAHLHRRDVLRRENAFPPKKLMRKCFIRDALQWIGGLILPAYPILSRCIKADRNPVAIHIRSYPLDHFFNQPASASDLLRRWATTVQTPCSTLWMPTLMVSSTATNLAN